VRQSEDRGRPRCANDAVRASSMECEKISHARSYICLQHTVTIHRSLSRTHARTAISTIAEREAFSSGTRLLPNSPSILNQYLP
jgi:hypothetical protein